MQQHELKKYVEFTVCEKPDKIKYFLHTFNT